MSGEQEGRQAAAEFREKHDFGLAPVEDVVALADLVGVDVVLVEAGEDEHGLTARDIETGVTVFVINSALSAVRFRSTLAHELGHHLFCEDLKAGQDHEYSSASETRAHAFARHLLLPLEAVRIADRDHPEFSETELLNWCVRRFAVSPKMAAYQLKNAKLINSDECDRFAEFTTGTLAWEYGWNDLRQARDRSVQKASGPRRLQELATRAYLAGRLPVAELAEIMNSSVEVIEEQLGRPDLAEPTALDFDDLADDDLSDQL